MNKPGMTDTQSNNANLTGAQRAAILLMACGEQQAAEIIKYLDPVELQKLAKTLAELDRPGKDSIGRVLSDFCEKSKQHTELGISNRDFLRTMLVDALGEERAGNLLDQVHPGWRLKGLEALKWMEPRAVADLLWQEHPQVVAVVLAFLDQGQSAQVLAALPEQLQVDVVMRIASLDGIRPVALREIDETLVNLLDENAQNLKTYSTGGLRTAAGIMNFLDGKLEAEIIAKIRGIDNDLGMGIQDLKFEFANLINLDDRAVQALLREVSSETVRIALRGANEAIKEKVLKNMSRRASEMLQDDLDTLGPVRLGEVRTAQKEILNIVWRMVESGELSLTGGGEAYI